MSADFCEARIPESSAGVGDRLPVRSEILAARRNEGLASLGFLRDIYPGGFRGSRGLLSINQAMLRVIERYLMEKNKYYG